MTVQAVDFNFHEISECKMLKLLFDILETQNDVYIISFTKKLKKMRRAINDFELKCSPIFIKTFYAEIKTYHIL